MVAPTGFKAADFGEDHDAIVERGRMRRITITWHKPQLWTPAEPAPLPERQQRPGFLYALSYDHHRAKRRESIAYVGISEDLDSRFINHPRANQLLERKRKTFLTVGEVDFGRARNASDRTRRVIEELEHILIWALWGDQPLVNERKILSLPGFGQRGGGAWHILNEGHRFRGQMPREIIWPWMLVKPGRNRSHRPTKAAAHD